MKMKIILDAMGGDNAPLEIVKGAIMAIKNSGVKICLVGRGEEILKAFEQLGINSLPAGIEIANATEVVEMSDAPSNVMREKKDSSMAVGLRMLNDGYGDAFASAGSTGALLTGSTLAAKRIRGIRRASLGTLMPSVDGRQWLLLDCGANIECTAEYILQFAYMGSFYAEKIMSRPSPRIALLNIGTEPSKGGTLQKESYELLMNAHNEKRINFAGNVEARDVMSGEYDAVITDGYTGNILLKSIEGMGLFFKDTLSNMFYRNILTKIAGLIVGSSIAELKKKMDYNSVGGAPLLGISKPVYKIHGSAKAAAVASAIEGAKHYVESGFIDAVTENIEFMKVDSAAE